MIQFPYLMLYFSPALRVNPLSPFLLLPKSLIVTRAPIIKLQTVSESILINA